MRKRYKHKLRSCSLCKPHKRGHASRWTPRQAHSLADAERDMRLALRAP